MLKKTIIAGSCMLMVCSTTITPSYALTTPSININYSINQNSKSYLQTVLNQYEYALFEKLNDPELWLNGTSVKITDPNNLSKDNLLANVKFPNISKALLHEAAHIFWVNFNIISFVVTEVNGVAQIEVTPFGEKTFYNSSYGEHDQAKVKEDYENFTVKLKSVAEQIKNEAPLQTPYFLSLGINSWLIDHNAYSSETAIGTLDNRRSAFSALMSENDASTGPVCVGYGYGFKALADELGLTSVTVLGNIIKNGVTIQHFWNRVQMDNGNWYDVDVTWNDVGGTIGNPRERFFLVGSDTETDTRTTGTPIIYKENHLIDKASSIYYPSIPTDRYTTTKPVAVIGETIYTSLQEAINQVQSGQTIRLFEDVTLTDTLEVGGTQTTLANVNKDFTLDLNGHTIKKSGNVIHIYPGSTMTLFDRTITPTSTLADAKGAIQQTSGGFGAAIKNEGTLIIKSGKIVVSSTSSNNFVSDNGYQLAKNSIESTQSTSNVKLVLATNPIEKIDLNETTLSLVEGNTHQLTATITPTNATNSQLTWESSQPDVATVDNGLVKAIKAGTTTITVKASNGISATCEVTVETAQKTNSWTTELTINSWEYGNTPSTPNAIATYGDVTYTYSNEKDGTYSSEQPTTAGVWYVKAQVIGTNDYSGLVSDPVQFEITKKKMTDLDITLPTSLEGTALDKLISVPLNGGWSWENPNTELNVNTQHYSALYTPADQDNYDYSHVTGYDQTTGAIKRSLTITVNPIKVTQIDLPTNLQGTVNNQLSSVNLPQNWSWVNPTQQLDLQTSSYNAIYTPTDTANYDYSQVNGYNSQTKTITQSLTVKVNKIQLTTITKPQDLKGKIGDTLSTITLPTHWQWQNPNEVLTYEKTEYTAIYTVPDDIYDYSQIEGYQGGKIICNIPVNIEKQTNEWSSNLTINNWEYQSTPSTPSITAKYGNEYIRYVYSNLQNGNYTSTIPTDAGTWYVKAIIDETIQYTGLESNPVEFTITRKKINTIDIPNNLSGIVGQKLSEIALPENWQWSNPDQVLTYSSQGMSVEITKTLTDENNYDYSAVPGYSNGKITVQVNITVSKKQNNWTTLPSIKDFTYGSKETPIASSQYGQVEYTYSSSINGPFTTTQPTQAGTWYLKASVQATDEYTSLEKVVSFTIKKAVPSYQLPQLDVEAGSLLSSISLPKGWTWNNPDLIIKKGNEDTYTATYTPDDTQNYETVTTVIPLSITLKKNEWIVKPSIENITFGEEISNDGYGLLPISFFMFSDSIDGTYTRQKPTDAGTYYAIAVIEENGIYESLQSDPIEFKIEPKKLDDVVLNENSDILFDQTELKEGIDYTVEKTPTENGYKLVITLQGNYSGTIVKDVVTNNTQPPIVDDTQTENNPTQKPSNDQIIIEDTSNPQVQQPEKEQQTVVQTGDHTSLSLYGILIAMSTAFIALFNKKKKSN